MRSQVRSIELEENQITGTSAADEICDVELKHLQEHERELWM